MTPFALKLCHISSGKRDTRLVIRTRSGNRTRKCNLGQEEGDLMDQKKLNCWNCEMYKTCCLFFFKVPNLRLNLNKTILAWNFPYFFFLKTKKKWRQYGKFIVLHPDEKKSDCLKGRTILSNSVSISSQNTLIANPCIKNSRYWWKSPRLSTGNQGNMNIMGLASVPPQSAKMSYWLQKQSLNTGGNRRSTKKVGNIAVKLFFLNMYS